MQQYSLFDVENHWAYNLPDEVHVKLAPIEGNERLLAEHSRVFPPRCFVRVHASDITLLRARYNTRARSIHVLHAAQGSTAQQFQALPRSSTGPFGLPQVFALSQPPTCVLVGPVDVDCMVELVFLSICPVDIPALVHAASDEFATSPHPHPRVASRQDRSNPVLAPTSPVLRLDLAPPSAWRAALVPRPPIAASRAVSLFSGLISDADLASVLADTNIRS